MIITIKQTKPGTELQRELSILTRDTHSPSGRIIHDGIQIEATTTVGYGKTFKVTPKGVPADFAISIYKELSHRSPALLNALMEAALKDSPYLEITVLNNGIEDDPTLSSHERIETIPILVAWLTDES
jgi:hypothetical protein